MKKQPQITEQTKLALKTAFWELYTQKPLEKITIKDITDTAGYNRGTFYLYYKDVYDIFTQVKDELLKEGIRVEVDDRNEKTGYKIREAQLQKIQYMLVVGAKEVEENLVAIRSHKDGDLGTMKLNEFIEKISTEIKNKG